MSTSAVSESTDEEGALALTAERVVGGRYRIVRPLGTGGMGSVYEATNIRTERPVAIKVLHDAMRLHPQLRARFLQEAKVASKLRHPNIVDVLDLDEQDGLLFIVQEFLRGKPLSSHLYPSDSARVGKGLPPREALEVLLPILSALGHAHRQGIVHRDLKPDNIFLSRDARDALVPKLIDFGIAKRIDQHAAHNITADGLIVGTPHYLSPEQANGDVSAIDHRTDLWAAGVVLYELLSGRLPFEGATLSVIAIKILTAPTPDVRAVSPQVPDDLARVIESALAKLPEGRFQSAAEFTEALLACRVARGMVDPDARVSRPTEMGPSLGDTDPLSASPEFGGHDAPSPADDVTPALEPRPDTLSESVREMSPVARTRRRWSALGAVTVGLAALGGVLFARTTMTSATPPAPRSSARTTAAQPRPPSPVMEVPVTVVATAPPAPSPEIATATPVAEVRAPRAPRRRTHRPPASTAAECRNDFCDFRETPE